MPGHKAEERKLSDLAKVPRLPSASQLWDNLTLPLGSSLYSSVQLLLLSEWFLLLFSFFLVLSTLGKLSLNSAPPILDFCKSKHRLIWFLFQDPQTERFLRLWFSWLSCEFLLGDSMILHRATVKRSPCDLVTHCLVAKCLGTHPWVQRQHSNPGCDPVSEVTGGKCVVFHRSPLTSVWFLWCVRVVASLLNHTGPPSGNNTVLSEKRPFFTHGG